MTYDPAMQAGEGQILAGLETNHTFPSVEPGALLQSCGQFQWASPLCATRLASVEDVH